MCNLFIYFCRRNFNWKIKQHYFNLIFFFLIFFILLFICLIHKLYLKKSIIIPMNESDLKCQKKTIEFQILLIFKMFIVLNQYKKHLKYKMWPDTWDMCIFVVTTFLFHLDFAWKQTILPCNQHTTLVGNSNLYNDPIQMHVDRLYNFSVI